MPIKESTPPHVSAAQWTKPEAKSATRMPTKAANIIFKSGTRLNLTISKPVTITNNKLPIIKEIISWTLLPKIK